MDGEVITLENLRQLLQIQTGLRGGMGPPVTYQLDGKQYVAVMGGTGPVQPRNGKAATPPVTPPVLPKLLTYSLP